MNGLRLVLRSAVLPLTVLIVWMVVLTGCKLNEDVRREETLRLISGSEKVFFVENVRNNLSPGDLTMLAKEAARSGYVQVLRYLANRGADLNHSDDFGWNPILIASETGNLAMVRFLVEIAGSDVRAKLRNRATTLMLAAGTGSLELCRYLLDRGANVNAKSETGLTAFMYASAQGSVTLMRFLAERGADTQATDSAGNSAFDYAASDSATEYLRSVGLNAVSPPGNDDATSQ